MGSVAYINGPVKYVFSISIMQQQRATMLGPWDRNQDLFHITKAQRNLDHAKQVASCFWATTAKASCAAG